jgi:hypothetical protein
MRLEKWKENASKVQQDFSNLLNDRVWEQYDAGNEENLLRDKIAFVTCGCLSESRCEYTTKENEIIDELLGKCIKNGKKDDFIYVSFLFVCAYQYSSDGIQVPLIRVMKNDGKVSTNSYFIDHVGRVYEDWSNFLHENIFDQWWICVPKNGIYSDSDEVELKFQDQTERGKVLKKVDKISTFTNLATRISMVTGTIMSFTPLAPLGVALVTVSAIAGTPGAVYSTGRSISRLVDRSQHDQSISIADAEAKAVGYLLLQVF